MLCVLLLLFDSLAPSLTLAHMRCPYDTVGGLPRLVIVERCTALAVVTGCVMSAHALAVDLSGQRTRDQAVSKYCNVLYFQSPSGFHCVPLGLQVGWLTTPVVIEPVDVYKGCGDHFKTL